MYPATCYTEKNDFLPEGKAVTNMGIVVMGAVFVDIKGYPDGQYIPAGRNAGRVLQVHGGVSTDVLEKLAVTLRDKVRQAQLRRIIVTLGERGSVYAEQNGSYGFCPPQETAVVDTTGAGDAFFAGAAIGLTYGKSLQESCVIGTRLASSVIATKENVCPRFLPEEFGL